MDEIDSLMHELGATFAAGLTQPGSMQVSLTVHGHQGRTYDAAGNAALIGRWGAPTGTDVYDLMRRLRSAVGTEGSFTVELTASPAADYVVSYQSGGDAGGTPLALEPVVILDPEYRLPGHPRPGMTRPARTVNDARPTDPTVLAEVQALVEQFTAEHTRLRGKPPRLAPGYSEAEILAAEGRLGVRLPEDIRALYRTIHDDNQETGLLGPFSPAPLEQVVAWYHQGDPGSTAANDNVFDDTAVVFETHPPNRVRRVSRNDWWLTFAPDYGMNYAMIDLDPVGSGEYGQILKFGRDVYGPVVYVAPSVRHLMRTVIAAMRRTAPGKRWDRYQLDPPRHQWLADVGSADLADMVAAVTDPASIQMVHLRQAARIHLPDLAGLPRLRAIRILDVQQKAVQVDLSVPPGLPVEQIDVTAEQYDPELLAGTPTLRYISLAGNTAPVRIAALAALPHLVRLDLAGAAISDVPALATFPALRVLTLNSEQWRELAASGWTPDRLAAARLGGHGGLADAAAWHDALSGASRPAIQHRTIRGPRY